MLTAPPWVEWLHDFELYVDEWMDYNSPQVMNNIVQHAEVINDALDEFGRPMEISNYALRIARVLRALGTAGAIAASDGPLPIMDVIAVTYALYTVTAELYDLVF